MAVTPLAPSPAPCKPVSRISMSLPEDLLAAVDCMVADRGFQSRSQAINEMLHRALLEHQSECGNEVMVGTIMLFYNNSVPGLQKRLSDLQSLHIDEVISSLHVHLSNNQTMEVLLVQGPTKKLHDIADEMITCRGVISGRIQLIAALIPQLHPFTDTPRQNGAR
jgi:CopG family transcriptional regulator, nickel-responsive regulator